MNYNTSRPKMIIPEYGRHIQKMVEHAVQLEDKEERTKMTWAIIDVMGQLNPQLRDVPDFAHKLWDHIFIISEFKLDVDSPYPIPAPESLDEKPKQMEYPSKNIRFKHYGKTVEDLVEKAISLEEGDERNAFTQAIGNLMKRHYLSWNRNSVEDEVILNDLNRISKGKLVWPEGAELASTSSIVPRKTNNSGGGGGKKKRKNYKQKRKY